jgi:hypothetical protein
MTPTGPGNDRLTVAIYDDQSSPLILGLKSEAMGSDKPAIYKSFLIRIWSDETRSQRRIMVIQVDASDRQYYFANLDDLMMFLLQEMEELSEGGSPGN